MTKKEIKAFFKAIEDNDIAKVTALINADSAYLEVCNVAPPKKDDGQSGLQVSLKAGHFEIAQLLAEHGADVNFIDTSVVNTWTAPVLHDSIRATIFHSYAIEKDTRKFDSAFSTMQLLLAKNANPNSTDSYGNNCLHRAILDSRQMIDHPNADLANGTLLQQLRKVFQALIAAGADQRLTNDKRPSAIEMIENFRLEQYALL